MIELLYDYEGTNSFSITLPIFMKLRILQFLEKQGEHFSYRSQDGFDGMSTCM